MGSQTIKTSWAGGLAFTGVGAFGTPITTDASASVGGQGIGYKPSELLLFGIAGCTGVDVVRILKKQRQEIHSLDIEVTGTNNDDFPKPYHTIEMVFRFTGVNLDPVKVEQAIKLSEEKYCMVGQTIQKGAKLSYRTEIIEAGPSTVSHNTPKPRG